MEMNIIKAGPLTTIQDAGRFGYMKYGIGESGAMDKNSYLKVNKLVGNNRGEAVLEATLMGPTLSFGEDALLAFMGADVSADVEGKTMERGRCYQILAGQKVTFGLAKKGVRLYIAIAGGIDVEPVMGSRSTNLKCRLGGYQGRKLIDGDVIRTGKADYSEKTIKKLLKRKIPAEQYSDNLNIRVIMGPQDDYFTQMGKNTFLEEEYKVTTESDRMGIRLLGPSIESENGMDIVSDGITFGSIQVTSAGLPIILMADHQTTGGYAKIATVIKEDLPSLAQARPGDTIRFVRVGIEDIQKRKSIFRR